MGLECDFAGRFLAGAIESKLQNGTEVQAGLTEALEVITGEHRYAQAAMCALVGRADAAAAELISVAVLRWCIRRDILSRHSRQ